MPSTSRARAGDVRARGRPGRRRRPPCGPSGVPRDAVVARGRSRARQQPSSSSQQPWTSPMMSNGPAGRGGRSTAGALGRSRRSTSSGRRSTWTSGSPRARRPRSERRSSRRWRRMTCGPNSRSGAVALRSWQIASGMSSTIATGRTWCSRASATSGARASGCTLVASITVSRPRAQARAGDRRAAARTRPRCAVWSFASSATSAAAGVGRQDLGRQEVRGARTSLARAAGADQHDEAQLGNRDRRSSLGNTAICVGGAERRVDVADGQEPHRVAVTGRRRRGPGPELGPRPLEAVVAVAQRPSGDVPRTGRCTRAFGVVTTTVRGRAEPNTRALERRQPRRVEVLDHLDQRGRVVARRAARSRYVSGPCSSVTRSRCAVGSRSSLQPPLGDLERPRATRRRRRSR